MAFYNVKVQIANAQCIDVKNVVVICATVERAAELVEQKMQGYGKLVDLDTSTITMCDHVPMSELGPVDSVLYDDKAIYPV